MNNFREHYLAAALISAVLGGCSPGGGSGGGGGDQEGRSVTFAEDWNQPDVVNTRRHPIISNLMAPLEQAGIEWSVSKICQAAKIKGGIASLPFVPNRWACYRFLLGKCKQQCPTACDHVDRDELPNATVEELCNRLAPGVVAMCAKGGTTTPPPSKKKRKQA